MVFLIGMYFYAINAPLNSDGFENNNSKQPRCPNLLIQKGPKFYLYNSKLAQVPGVNPIEFDNLEDYTEFLDWQKSQNIRCPVLYLQETYDAQGERVYKSRPSVSNPQAGLPPSIASPVGIASQEQSIDRVGDPAYPNPTMLVDATRNDPPYNNNSYPAYDQSSYYVGTTTPLDAMDIKQESAKQSPNPMDPNWGGAAYTSDLVKKGYYDSDNVSIQVQQ
tara:strand:- start:1620 stop:2279 length:660 start_codon:yes stop_codon:yes gene_type:complete